MEKRGVVDGGTPVPEESRDKDGRVKAASDRGENLSTRLADAAEAAAPKKG